MKWLSFQFVVSSVCMQLITHNSAMPSRPPRAQARLGLCVGMIVCVSMCLCVSVCPFLIVEQKTIMTKLHFFFLLVLLQIISQEPINILLPFSKMFHEFLKVSSLCPFKEDLSLLLFIPNTTHTHKVLASSYIIHMDFCPSSPLSRSCYPSWILKRAGLESSGQRLLNWQN